MSDSPILMRRPLRASEPAAVRPAGYRLVAWQPEWAPLAHALLAEGYADGSGAVPPAADLWWQAVSSDEEFDPALCFLVCDAGEAPAAFALCWTSNFVKDLVVAPSHRRRGLATALLSNIFSTLAARGAEDVRLKVHVDNPSRAQDLYARLGFSPV